MEFVLHFIFKFVMSFPGKFFFSAVVCIVFHSVCCLSIISGSACILVICRQYAVILCSKGWLDMKLIVVSFVVGFRLMSISRLDGFLINGRSKKLKQLLFTRVGLSCRFGCIWFMYSWMHLR